VLLPVNNAKQAGLIAFSWFQGENMPMQIKQHLFLTMAIAFGWLLPDLTQSASTIYYCPDRKSDQQYSARPAPGCVPLIEQNQASQGADSPQPKREPTDFKIENLQSDVSAFLSRYRQLLECCKTDPSELQQIDQIGDEVGDLLKSTQAKLSNHSLVSSGIMLREMILPVAKARADIKTLRATLNRIGAISNTRESGTFEESGRAAQAIREMEETIERDIRAPKLSTGPKTGAGIGTAPAAGPSIGKTPKTGNTIGAEGVTGQDIGAPTRHSHEIGTSGPAGFAIGTTGRAGPSIGESTFNSESSSAVGSSLQRSTVGSSLSDSTVGSSFGGSGVGSSLGNSSPGSTIQERSADPQQ
jgi:hypothetical protein